MAFIALTGEFTPPGSTRCARSNSCADRLDVSVLALPGLEVAGEVQEADLLELRRGVQRRPVLDAADLGLDGVEDRVALLLRAAVGHREDLIRPVLVGRPLVAVADAAEGGHPGADLHDPVLRDLPDPHAVGA